MVALAPLPDPVPLVDDDADDTVTGEAAAVVGRTRSDLEHAAVNPDHDR